MSNESFQEQLDFFPVYPEKYTMADVKLNSYL